MSPWQYANQLRDILDDAVWPDGAGEEIFGKVVASFAPPPPALELLAAQGPFAVVRPMAGRADPEHTQLLDSRFEIVIGAVTHGDPFGENVLVGANRSGGAGSSKGRGLLELEERVLAAVRQLSAQNGVNAFARAAGRGGGEALGDGRFAAQLSLEVEATLTSARTFPPASRLTAVAAGGGAVTLAWTLPPARFDRREVVLRRAAGATAPASPTAGTGISLSGLLATSKTDTPGAGQFSYALFAGYDQYAAAASDAFSAAVTATVTAT